MAAYVALGRQGRVPSDQQSNCQKINSLMSRFTAKPLTELSKFPLTEFQNLQNVSREVIAILTVQMAASGSNPCHTP